MRKKAILGFLSLMMICRGPVVLAESSPDQVLFTIDELDHYEKDGSLMLGVRQLAERLGYKVEWNESLRQVEISKDAFNTSIKEGKDYYFSGRMAPVRLGLAPEIKEGTSYVPQEFFQELLGHNIQLEEEGLVLVVQEPLRAREAQELIDIRGYVKGVEENQGEISLVLGLEESKLNIREILVHIMDETSLENSQGERVLAKNIKLGDRLDIRIPKYISMSNPPQTAAKEIVVNKFIELEKFQYQGINYPTITKMEDLETQKDFNRLIRNYIEQLESNESFKDLNLDYTISRLDDEMISIIFSGSFRTLAGGERQLVKSLSYDFKEAREISFENYFKDDAKSQELLAQLMRAEVMETYNKELEAEGYYLYFTETDVVIYYYELDDMVTIPREIYINTKEIKDLIR